MSAKSMVLEVVRKSILLHLWYLTEELVEFELFDNELGTSERKAMANKILTIEQPHLFNPLKPKFPNNRMTPSPTLDVFIGPRSWLVFDKLRATGDWLNNAVENWKNDEEYKRMQFLLHDLKVVNDLAERCVKDIKDYVNA